MTTPAQRQAPPPAADASPVARLSWPDFVAQLDWRQGEHATAIGPTGSGKTTLFRALIEDAYPHPWRALFSTKRRGTLVDWAAEEDYHHLTDWRPVSDPEVCPRVLLAPPLRNGIESQGDQRDAFRYALRSIYKQGGWLVYLDELKYLAKNLGLAEDVELLILQGRELGVTMVQGVQRPRHVPLSVYDQATHLFFFHNADGQTLRRLEELVEGMDPETAEQVRSAARSLHSHELLYANPRANRVIRTQAEV